MNKKRIGPLALVLALGLAVALVGCDDEPNDNQLIAALRLHRTSLEVVAEQLIAAGPDARIDLRGERPIFQPPVGEVEADELATVLRDAEVNLAVNDAGFGGVLFRTYGRGVAVEGVASGFVYRTADQFGDSIKIVDDLQAALAQAQEAGKANGQAVNLRLAHPVDGRWGIYLETF